VITAGFAAGASGSVLAVNAAPVRGEVCWHPPDCRHEAEGVTRLPRGLLRGLKWSHLVSFPEDQHPVGEIGADGQHKPLGEAVRPRTMGRDLDHLDTRIGQHRAERDRELAGAIANEEPEPPRVLAEVHHEVAGLLRPRVELDLQPGPISGEA
jgi:hypothetical protein